MESVARSIGKVLSFVFAAVVITFTAWMTFMLAQRLIPDNLWLQAITVMLFDGAALIWFVMFLAEARGTWQWAIAGIGFGVGLVGAIIMAGGELVLGQKLVALDDPTRLNWLLVTTVVVAAALHAVLIYAFHFLNPEVWNRVNNASKVSEVIERAYKSARGEIDRQADDLARDLVETTIQQARLHIAREVAHHIRTGATQAQPLSIPASVQREQPPDVILGSAPMAPEPGNDLPSVQIVQAEELNPTRAPAKRPARMS